jgi:hypothetical protein
MKRVVCLLAFVSILFPLVPSARAQSLRDGGVLALLSQSDQGLEISVLGLKRQKTWGFSDGKPDPSAFLKTEKPAQSEYEGTIEPNRLKLKWSEGSTTLSGEFEFVALKGTPPTQSSGLRFDGFYRRPIKHEDNSRTFCDYLGFFEDGTVAIWRSVMCASFGAPSQRVPYTIEGSKIRFAVEPFLLQQQQPPIYGAEPGYDMVVLLLKVKTLQAKVTLDFSRLLVEDEQGKTYKCILLSSSICGLGVQGAEETCGVPFIVPEGTRLKKLRYGETSFDLQQLESSKGAPR